MITGAVLQSAIFYVPNLTDYCFPDPFIPLIKLKAKAQGHRRE